MRFVVVSAFDRLRRSAGRPSGQRRHIAEAVGARWRTGRAGIVQPASHRADPAVRFRPRFPTPQHGTEASTYSAGPKNAIGRLPEGHAGRSGVTIAVEELNRKGCIATEVQKPKGGSLLFAVTPILCKGVHELAGKRSLVSRNIRAYSDALHSFHRIVVIEKFL